MVPLLCRMNLIHRIEFSRPDTLSITRHAPSSLGGQLGKEHCMHVMIQFQAPCAHSSFEACGDSCDAVHRLCAIADSKTMPTTGLRLTMSLFLDKIARGQCAFFPFPVLAQACSACRLYVAVAGCVLSTVHNLWHG